MTFGNPMRFHARTLSDSTAVFNHAITHCNCKKPEERPISWPCRFAKLRGLRSCSREEQWNTLPGMILPKWICGSEKLSRPRNSRRPGIRPISFMSILEKRSASSIQRPDTDLYAVDQLVGKLVVGVVNFPPKQIGPIMSECLVTGFHTGQGVALCVPDREVPLGAKLC